jgi:three-Cys-motif partner protein
MNKAFFTESRREWSARKHAILREYLPAFCTALSQVSKRHYDGVIWYVDGFAGAGRHEKDNSPGSPLLALEAIEKLPYDIRCLNVEEDKACFASLEREIAAHPKVTNMCGDFNDVVDEVLSTVHNCPTLFFLDPFGMKDLPMVGQLEKIARRSLATDVLLRYDTHGISRVIGAAGNITDSRSSAHCQSLDRIFHGSGWRSIADNTPTGKERDEVLLAHYLTQITGIRGGRFRFAAAYPIRTIEGNLKYHMVFATGNRLGVKLMSDVLHQAEISYLSDYDAHLQQQQAAQLAALPAIQLDLFAPEAPMSAEQLREQHIAAVQATLLKVGAQKKAVWEFEALYYELLLHEDWFARLSEKDYREACKGLAGTGKIERLSEGRAWKQGIQFRITG